jgi:hypothetical protein
VNINNLSQRQFPDALPPTMTAAQLRHTASLEQDEPKYAGAPDMWREKLGQTPVGMVQAIAAEGATHPVKLRREGRLGEHAIQDGHHNIAAAFEIDPEMQLPVEWDR